MSFQVLVPWFTLSVCCVVFSVLVMSLWRPCVPPSLNLSQCWRDGLVRRCSVPPSLLSSSLMMFSTGTLGPVSIPVPSSVTPAGNSSKIWVLTLLFQCPKGSWVPRMCAWDQEIPTNEPSYHASQTLLEMLGYSSQDCRSCTYPDLRPKKDPRVDRDIKGLIDGMISISEVKGSWRDTHCG